MEVDERLNEVTLLNLRRYNGFFFLNLKKIKWKLKNKIKLLEGMKYWTKKTIIEEDEKLNKVGIANKNRKKKRKKKRKDAEDVVHKELYKIYYKTPLLYIV